MSKTRFALAPVKVTSSFKVDVPLTSIFPFKSTFPSCTAPSSVTVPVTLIPVELTLTLVVPPVVISKLSAALEKIPVFKSSRNPSAGALAEPSSSVKVPSSCNKVIQPSFALFLIFKTPVLVSAHH